MKNCNCEKCKSFRKTHDFEFLDIYGLSTTIAEFLVPRLKAFGEETFSHPTGMTLKEWKSIVNEMTIAFEILAKDDIILEEDINKKIEKGLSLFAKYFHDLWI